ncbi:MAG: hypothetical protein U9Q74_03900 [Gemmatimonadota bacterium]|nr:hypothetical protein [Gemmatimonadota bacterium]
MTRLAIAVLALVPLPAALAQRPTFGPTLFWETGLVNVPAAAVAPLGGDLAFNFTRLALDSSALPAGVRKAASYNLSLSASLWGHGEVGISVFSGDLKSGLFGKLMLVDQTDGIWRRGFVHWLPSIAIGVRNVGTEKTLNRLAVADESSSLNTLGSLYGVATRTFVLAPGETPARPAVQLSLTAGHGTGLFSDDGGMGKSYASAATGGTFGGASLDLATGRFSSLSLMAEQDGWGVNAGARVEWRGVRVAVFGTDLGNAADAAGAAGAPGGRYTGSKVALTVGWQANALTLVRGDALERRTQQLQTEQGDLARQVRLAQQRIDVIEGQIDALQAIASQERNAERSVLERQLREEQEALRRLQDLIKAREAAKRPPEPQR